MSPPSDAEGVRLAAEGSPDLESLAGLARTCTACPELAGTRRQVVPGVVPPPPVRLLLMGEAPGATEDATGLPFVGRSGQLLDELLALAGVARGEVGVLNTLKCRPPGNRPPTRTESRNCRPWTLRQLELAEPAVVVALGLSAARWFLGPTTLAAVRGRVHEVGGVRVLPTYHPSAALRGGPAGEPRQLLAADLAAAVRCAQELR
ncbi:MAG: phage polymerase-related protein [Frankiales bacterium]|nr:phage polymerase-related protein [Frankiales bacterium]